MQFVRGVAALLVLTLLAFIGNADQPPQRDQRAALVLQAAFGALGGSMPSDFQLTGTVELVEGSLLERGTVRILGRGLEQSREEIQTPSRQRKWIHSHGRAAAVEDYLGRELSLEAVVISQTAAAPLQLVGRALLDSEWGCDYLGLVALAGTQAHHIRLWQSFSKDPRLEHLAVFSQRELWVDAVTGLPLKLAFVRREAVGPAPSVAFGVTYSDYRAVDGLAWPFSVQVSRNGVRWARYNIETVTINSGLSDRDFSIE